MTWCKDAGQPVGGEIGAEDVLGLAAPDEGLDALRRFGVDVYEIISVISVISGGKVGDSTPTSSRRVARAADGVQGLYCFVRAPQDRLHTVAARLLRPSDAPG